MSAVGNLDDAVNVISGLEKDSGHVDAGLYVKTFLIRNLFQGQKNDTAMAENLTAVTKNFARSIKGLATSTGRLSPLTTSTARRT